MANANSCPTGQLIELTLPRLRNCVFSAAVSVLALALVLALISRVPYYSSIVAIAKQLRRRCGDLFFFKCTAPRLTLVWRTQHPSRPNFSKQSRNKLKRRRERRRRGNCARERNFWALSGKMKSARWMKIHDCNERFGVGALDSSC